MTDGPSSDGSEIDTSLGDASETDSTLSDAAVDDSTASDATESDAPVEVLDGSEAAVDALDDVAADATGGVITVDAGTCMPLTCATMLGKCGKAANGCGGSLDCGTCTTTTTVSLALGARDLAYDRTRGLLYVSTPATDRYVAVRAGDGVQAYEFPAGAGASTLALSSDDGTLYVGLEIGRSVRKVKLSTLSSNLTFALGSSPYFGTYWAGQMAVVPGAPDTVVISRQRAVSPHAAGVAVFDDGVMRPGTTEEGGEHLIALADATTVYAYNDESTDYRTYRLRIKPSGLVEEFVAEGVISGFNLELGYESGRLFTTRGATVDTTSMLNVGSYVADGAVVSDSSTNRVYYTVNNGSNRELVAFDRTTFAEVARVTLGASAGAPRRLIRWGSQGLAYLEYASYTSTTARLVLVNSSLVLPTP